MTAVKTWSSGTVQSKAKCLIDDPASRNPTEINEPETSLDRYRRWRLEVDEREKKEGTFDVEPPSMEEIVAIVKEVRAERYAKKQKNSTCR